MKHAVCSLSLRIGRRCQREAWGLGTESDLGGESFEALTSRPWNTAISLRENLGRAAAILLPL